VPQGDPAQVQPSGGSAAASPGAAETGAAMTSAIQRIVAEARLDNAGDGGLVPAAGQPEPARRQAALTAGIQEITNTLVGDHTLNDVLRIILETMYRAIGFQRVLLFSLDPREQSLRCRFGFGTDADVITQNRISVPLHGNRDLFYAAVVMGADLCLDDLESDRIRPHVPKWYKSAIGARGILLLPIVNRKRTLGLIYADSDVPAVLHFSTEELSLLKTLRNQALLAMRQTA
jgi:GAF domain-containing protein